MSGSSVDYGFLAAAFSNASPWADAQGNAPQAPPPTVATSSYAEFSQAWLVGAAQNAQVLASDVKSLVDSLYAYVLAQTKDTQEGVAHALAVLQEENSKRTEENQRIEKQNLELKGELAQAGARIVQLEKELVLAQNAFTNAQAAFDKAQKASEELKQKYEGLEKTVSLAGTGTIGSGISAAATLSQTLFPTMKEPDTFSGDKNSKLDEWLESMALWLRHRQVVHDEQKILTAITYLKGNAKNTMQSYFDSIKEGKSVGTYEDFVNCLRKDYEQTNSKDKAIAEFNQLVGKTHKDFGQFAAQFRSLARRTGFSNEEIKNRLYTHVPKEAASVLLSRGRTKWAERWEDFIKDVQDILQDQRLLNGTILSGNGQKQQKDPDAMEVDAKQKGSSKDDTKPKTQVRQALSWEEAKRTGKCVLCGGQGHRKKECPLNSKTPSSGKATTTSSTKQSSGNKGKDGHRRKGKGVHALAEGSDDEDGEVEESADEQTDSDSENEAPKQSKRKKSSSVKTQVNRVVISSEDEDFVRGPL